MKCTACGSLNEADAIFCKGCGTKFGVSKCSQCGVTAEPDALFCSKCGAQVGSNDPVSGKTCQSCSFVNSAGTTYCKRCNQKII